MIDYEELIKQLILPLASIKEDVEVENLSKDDNDLEYKAYVNEKDLGRVIGKGGMIARAVRTILYAAASKEGKRIHLEITSKENN